MIHFDIQRGRSLGLTCSTTIDRTRRGTFRTFYMTFGRTHAIVSVRWFGL